MSSQVSECESNCTIPTDLFFAKDRSMGSETRWSPPIDIGIVFDCQQFYS